MQSFTNELTVNDNGFAPLSALSNQVEEVPDLENRLKEMLFMGRFMGATSTTLVPQDICSIAARTLYDFIRYESVLFMVSNDFGIEPLMFSPGKINEDCQQATEEHKEPASFNELKTDEQFQGIIFKTVKGEHKGVEILLPEKMGRISITYSNNLPNCFSAELFSEIASHFASILKNSLAHEKIKELATKDSLTSLFNRRVFDEILSVELNRKELMPVSLLLVDLDDFKKINDTFGHQAGDQVLAAVGKILREGCRGSDMVARYGGEEFAVMLPSTTSTAASEIARRLRVRIADTVFVFEGKSVKLTASMGIAQSSGGIIDAMSQLISRADQALYRAKKSGKNRECVADCRTTEITEIKPARITDSSWLKSA